MAASKLLQARLMLCFFPLTEVLLGRSFVTTANEFKERLSMIEATMAEMQEQVNGLKSELKQTANNLTKVMKRDRHFKLHVRNQFWFAGMLIFSVAFASYFIERKANRNAKAWRTGSVVQSAISEGETASPGNAVYSGASRR